MRNLIAAALAGTVLLSAGPAFAYKIFVSNEKGNDVTVLDGESFEIIHTIKAGQRPRGIVTSPDGTKVYAMLQSSMVDEGGSDGVMNRIVEFDAASGTANRQLAYRMDTSSQGRGISALVALNDSEFLVLERNNRGLGSANYASPDKRVYTIDITGYNERMLPTPRDGSDPAWSPLNQ